MGQVITWTLGDMHTTCMYFIHIKVITRVYANSPSD